MVLQPTERRALTLSAFVAACICFAPGQVVSGAFLLLVSLLLYRWDRRQSAREAGAGGGESEEQRITSSTSPPSTR